MFPKKTIKDIKPRGKIVLVRTDYNVPMKDGEIMSGLRIRASLPTLNYLLDHGAKKVIIISHLGRPEGRDEKLSLRPIAEHLGKLLENHPVSFVDDVSGPDVEAAVKKVKKGGVLVLENLRFFPGEKQNSPDFSQEIIESTHADYFVQDGFAVLHRAHASTSAIARDLPSVAGLLVEKEVSTLSKLIKSPEHPFLVIIGGSKIEDKQPLIDHFTKIADHVFVGGKIAADGYVSKDKKIIVAEDFVTDDEGNRLDIGPKSLEKILALVAEAKTILWNGTLGYAEDPQYAVASTKVAEAIGNKPDATTIIGGGDTTGFVENLQKSDPSLSYSLVSTGGGATLEFLLNGTLSGLEALDN